MATQRKIKRKIFTAIGVLALVVGLFVFMFSGDNYEILLSLLNDDLSAEQFKETIRSFGIKGSVTLSILSMLQVVLTFLPAEPVQVLSGISYGFWHGAAICLVGVFVGNNIIYLLYRVYGEKLTDYFKKNIDLDFEKIRESKRVALIVFILYFLPAIPYGLICFFSASLKMKYPRYILLTTIGSIPSILIGVGLGDIAMTASWITSLIVFAVLLVLIVLMCVYRKAIFKKVNDFIHKQNKNAPIVVKPQNRVLRFFVRTGFTLFIRAKIIFRLKKNVKVKGPCIVLCNHGSFLDFIYACMALPEIRPQFMAARLYFYHKQLSWLLRNLGAYPKSMFSKDIETIKNSMRILQKNGVIVMMPEARLSTVGKFEDIQDTTYKFIKKMGVDVYTLHIDGAYLAKPKWGDKLRNNAPVDVVVNPLFTKEELEALDEETIATRINEAVYYNEFEWLKTRPEVKYKLKTLAEGLENVLHVCPECGSYLTIQTKKRDVFCTHCGMKATMDDRYGFVDNKPFENFQQWYDWQKERLKEEILSSEDYVLEEEVELFHSSKNGKKLVQFAGKGRCRLDRKGLTYVGRDGEEEVEKHFSMDTIYRLLFGAGEDFEIYDGKEIYYFQPNDKRSCVRWYMASEILKNLHEGKL